SSIRLVEQVAKARPQTPLVAMAYANQVLGGGDGAAVAQRLADAGASRTIVTDPTPDAGAPYEAAAATAGLAAVALVAPTPPPDRRAWSARRSGGFLYCVSLLGVAGQRQSLPSSVGRLIREVVAVSPVPVAVGFGIGRREQAHKVARAGAAGIAVG